MKHMLNLFLIIPDAPNIVLIRHPAAAFIKKLIYGSVICARYVTYRYAEMCPYG
jgi:hypothetical protein